MSSRFTKIPNDVREQRLTGLLCLEELEMIELAGAPESSEYQYLSIEVNTCEGASCQTQTAIDAYFKGLVLQV
jgi:hypothetical protein